MLVCPRLYLVSHLVAARPVVLNLGSRLRTTALDTDVETYAESLDHRPKTRSLPGLLKPAERPCPWATRF